MKELVNDASIITIIESDLGPLISESRATVYDVMEAYDEGYDSYGIGKIYNLCTDDTTTGGCLRLDRKKSPIG